MAGLKEIKRRLKSVRNTKKITYAMKLVSAAKLRRAQEAVTMARSYTEELNSMLAQLAQSGGIASSHPLMTARSPVQRVAVIVIGGQRGLCGGYNSNVNRRVEAFYRDMAAVRSDGTKIIQSPTAFVLGKKPAEHFRRTARAYEQSWEELPEDAIKWPVSDITNLVEEGFLSGKFDEVFMIYTRFKSAVSMQVILDKILPIGTDMIAATASAPHGQSNSHHAPAGLTLFEPSAEDVFAALVPRYLSSRIRQACLDAKASETASRMTAMDAATKNAGQLVRKLELTHNRIRQQGITSQLLDIIGGAEAIK